MNKSAAHKFINLRSVAIRRGPATFRSVAIVAAALALAIVVLAQSADKRLVINGRNTSVPVRRIEGRSYVDIEALAHAINGSATFEPSRIVLTIPGATLAGTGSAASNSGAAQSSSQSRDRLSRDFATAANYALSGIREWKGSVATMVTYGMAVDSSWATEYHDRVLAGVTQASVASTSDADRQALQLLQNEFSEMANWANNVLADRRQFNGERTVNPNALADDVTYKKIGDCDRYLTSMLVGGSFSDSAVCH